MSLLVNIINRLMFSFAILNQSNKSNLMKKIFTLFTASLFSIAVNAQTVVDIIVNSDDHNTLEAAVLAANLQGTLAGPGPFTVFAPTDAAFAALPAGTVDALLANIPALTNILTYHAVGANALSTSLTNGQMITTIQGQKVTVTINNGNVFINNAYVTVVDLVATNGVVHVIDAVLLPPTGTVVDVIVNSPNHTTLEAAVLAAGLETTLSGTGPFTIFAPTDAAFAALPAGTIAALLADIPALTNILTYHAVSANAFSAGLNNGQMVMTLQGQNVTVTIDNGVVLINDAQVTVADIVATNGVVHVIDAVLLPSTPSNGTVVDIIVNSTNHTTLETAVIAAGLAGTLSGTGPFTVFAPTDAAFAAVPAATLNALLADPNGLLTDVLLHHVVGSTAFSSDLTNGQAVPTLFGDNVIVTINLVGNVSIDNATVTVADIEATNGVVHVIDAVLVPATLGVTNVSNSKVGVYPNPVSDVLRFNLGQTTTNATYQVFNQTGALVLSGNFNSSSSISVEDLQSGLYTVTVLENNNMSSVRFVKN